MKINLPTIPNRLYKLWEKNTKYYANSEIKTIDDGKGCAVFAKENIPPASLIEYAAGMPLAHKEKYHNDPVILQRSKKYICFCNECQKHGNSLFLFSGNFNGYRYSMSFNQSNADCFFVQESKLLIIYSLKEIVKGSEIILFHNTETFKAPEITPTD
jgi:hypothetical protein